MVPELFLSVHLFVSMFLYQHFLHFPVLPQSVSALRAFTNQNMTNIKEFSNYLPDILCRKMWKTKKGKIWNLILVGGH